jgi:hypothetical protein
MARKKLTADDIRFAFASGEHQLVGTWEAAEIIGVERPRIGRWLNRWRIWMFGDKDWQKTGGKKGVPPHVQAEPDDWTYGPEPDTRIPKPLADTKAGPVWLRSDIEAFAAARRARRASGEEQAAAA